jgi:acetyl/propionyl-CoA carboxylase alpha subunit
LIPPHYDSMIAKLITHGADRAEAIARMKRALRESVIEGVDTTIPYHLEILNNADFLAGTVDTHFVEKHKEIQERMAALVAENAAPAGPGGSAPATGEAGAVKEAAPGETAGTAASSTTSGQDPAAAPGEAR